MAVGVLTRQTHLPSLSSQIRRAAISVPSNLAEGYRRRRFGSQLQFELVAYGSASELETQLMLIQDLKLADTVPVRSIEQDLEHVLRLLNGYCTYLRHQRNGKTYGSND